MCGPQWPFYISSSFILFFLLLVFFLKPKSILSVSLKFMASPIIAHVEPGASKPCTISRTGFLFVGHLSPSPMGNLNLVNDRGSASEGASSAILW